MSILPRYLRTMKPWGRFLIIFVAYSIALLHTAVPHHHAQVQGDGPVLVHNGCFLPGEQNSLLQKVLSTDLGVGHLENFKQNTDSQPDFTPRLAFLAILTVVVRHIETDAWLAADSFGSHIEKLCRQRLLLPVSSFRGPPSC